MQNPEEQVKESQTIHLYEVTDHDSSHIEKNNVSNLFKEIESDHLFNHHDQNQMLNSDADNEENLAMKIQISSQIGEKINENQELQNEVNNQLNELNSNSIKENNIEEVSNNIENDELTKNIKEEVENEKNNASDMDKTSEEDDIEIEFDKLFTDVDLTNDSNDSDLLALLLNDNDKNSNSSDDEDLENIIKEIDQSSTETNEKEEIKMPQKIEAAPVVNENIPQETPIKRRSMIPVQSNRKNPLPREVFETPSFKPNEPGKVDEILQSNTKPKIARNLNRESTSRRPSRLPYNRNSNRNSDARSLLNSTYCKKQNIQKTARKPNNESNMQLNSTTPSGSKANQVAKTPCSNNNDIFNRLFEQSTIKKKNPNAEQEESELNSTRHIEVQSIISSKSNNIATKREIANISKVVGTVDECSIDNLKRILTELKIIDATTTEDEHKMIEKELKRCLIRDNVYSAKKLEGKLVDSVTLRRSHKFNIFINNKLAIARANEKPVLEQQEEAPEPAKSSATMQKETFDRLIASKPIPVAEQEPNEQKNDKPILSRASKFILQNSQRTHEISQLPLEQRDKYLLEIRKEAIQKLEATLHEEEEKEMRVKPQNLGQLPEFYGNLPSEIKQRQNHTVIKNDEAQFKPKTISYSAFLQNKDKIFGGDKKIAGAEERIKRLRLARIERNELQEALDPRALPAELKNMKKRNTKKKSSSKQVTEIVKKEEETSPCTDEIDGVLGI